MLTIPFVSTWIVSTTGVGQAVGGMVGGAAIATKAVAAVSYTHLDVYKRQPQNRKNDYLSNRYFEHFKGRIYTDISTLLFLARPASLVLSAMGSLYPFPSSVMLFVSIPAVLR